MEQCWKTQPDTRPTFSALVANIEEYLSDIMDYVNPLTTKTDPSPDPYFTWRLMPVSEEMEREETSSSKPEGGESGDAITGRQRLLGHRTDGILSKQRALSSTSQKKVSRMASDLARKVANGMVRRSTSAQNLWNNVSK